MCYTYGACESLAGRQLRSGMSYRKWSRIRLPVRPIAPLGGGAAGCFGAQGDDNNKEGRGGQTAGLNLPAVTAFRYSGCWYSAVIFYWFVSFDRFYGRNLSSVGNVYAN